METLWQDLRYGTRQLARSPGFTVVAVLTLALGIGANTAIFSVVNAVLLRPLPAADPQQLAVVMARNERQGLLGDISYPDYQFYRQNNGVFSDLAVQILTQVNLSGEGRAERAWVHVVSANFFTVLGLQPGLGRTILPNEDQPPGGHPVIVLGHGFWQRAFGGDPAIVGKTVRINGYPLEIVGVVPPDFHGLEWGAETDAYLPLAMIEQARPGWQALLQARRVDAFRVIGRLRSGVTVQQANAAMNVLARQLAQQYPETKQPATLTVIPETRTRPSPYVAAYVLPLAALFMTLVGLVLLIACANVANLLLARAVAREKEMAIRAAVGAGRGRLIRQVLTETLVLALLGGAAGLGFAVWGTAALGNVVATAVASAVPVVNLGLDPDFRVYAFALLIALGAGAVAGLVPALQAARTDPQGSLQEGGRSSGPPARRRLRSVLVVVQVAVSIVLLTCAGLFTRSLQYAGRIDVGFQPQGLFTMALDPVLQGYDQARRREFYQVLLERVRSLPGVQSAAVSPFLPFRGGFAASRITVPGSVPVAVEDLPTVWSAVVSEDYFSTMGIPILRGRTFNAQDSESAQRVVIVNEAMAREFWPGEDPLGKRLSTSGPQGPFWEVVGVAKDGMYLLLQETPRPFMYQPSGQASIGLSRLYVRTGANPAGLIDAVRAEVRRLDPAMPVFHVSTLEDELNATALLPVRMGALLVGSLGALGLLLTSIGLYGVIAYSVSQRSHEIGVRLAIGAKPSDVLRLVIRQGLLLTMAGGTAGLLAAYALAGLMTSFLVGVSPFDPVTYAAIPIVLGGVAVLACWVPARRAARVDPMVALRYE